MFPWASTLLSETVPLFALFFPPWSVGLLSSVDNKPIRRGIFVEYQLRLLR